MEPDPAEARHADGRGGAGMTQSEWNPTRRKHAMLTVVVEP